MNVETWGLITRIIAIISIGTLVGQAAARLLGLIKKPFFQRSAGVIECAALLASLMVTMVMIVAAMGKLPGEGVENSVETLQSALYADLMFIGTFAFEIGAVVVMFHLVRGGAPWWRVALGLVVGAVAAFLLFQNLAIIVQLFLVVLEEGDAGWSTASAATLAIAYGGPVAVVLAALYQLPAVSRRVAAVRRWMEDHVPFVRERAAVRTDEASAPSADPGEGKHRANR